MAKTKQQPAPVGNKETRIVRRYLESLESRRGPGRRATPESVERMLAQVEAELSEATSLERLTLLQRRLDLLAAQKSFADHSDDDAEAAFIEIAGTWSARKGVSYQAWRDAGVPARVLRDAGISRTAG